MKCFYCCLNLDASSLISVTSVKRLFLRVEVTTRSALSAIFASTAIVDLTLSVMNLKPVSKLYDLLNNKGLNPLISESF